MNPDEFSKMLIKKQTEFKNYVNNVFPKNAGDISLRFIDKNFRDQGYHGEVFQPWLPIKRQGTILVKSGTLRRGNSYTTTPGVTHVINNVKYASVQNNGFKGPVQVKAFQRHLLKANKVATGRVKSGGNAEVKTIHSISGIVNVRPHTRIMNIPKRQFFPLKWNDSFTLRTSLIDEMKTNMKRIFNQ